MGDQITRGAARWATLIAVPAALLAGLGIFAGMGGFGGDGAAPEPTTTTPRPQATTPVPMAATALSPRAESVCRALLARLPDALRDRARRPVTAGPEQNAAYGDPAITVSCGTPMPVFPPTDLVYPLDRVCWHAAETPDATVWTTVDRELSVRVRVPRAYEQPGQWVIALSPSVTAAIPRAAAGKIPSGCG
ncbi:MAG TPA: DUF3515 family protein [Pilimelia sp.]|nr:DUF3515 family protein [Pilimelia sp.]